MPMEWNIVYILGALCGFSVIFKLIIFPSVWFKDLPLWLRGLTIIVFNGFIFVVLKSYLLPFFMVKISDIFLVIGFISAIDITQIFNSHFLYAFSDYYVDDSNINEYGTQKWNNNHSLAMMGNNENIDPNNNNNANNNNPPQTGSEYNVTGALVDVRIAQIPMNSHILPADIPNNLWSRIRGDLRSRPIYLFDCVWVSISEPLCTLDFLREHLTDSELRGLFNYNLTPSAFDIDPSLARDIRNHVDANRLNPHLNQYFWRRFGE